MNKDQALKILNNENLTTQEIAELSWILNRHQYKERPVTIEEFYSSDDFVHKKWPNIFPLWKQTLSEIFPTPFNAPYNEILISAAAGSGKEQCLNSKLLTPHGYINMGDVTLQDQLLDGYGNVCNVTGIYPQGKKPVYQIVLEDKSTINVGLNHINHVYFQGLPLNIETKDLLKNFSQYKIAKWNDKQELYSIRDIKYVYDDYCQCIMVDSPHHTYISNNEIITHNTVTATISVLYDMYKLGCLIDPCSFYGLTPDTMIIMAIFSATGSTAAVNWNDITTGIEACPWMMEKLVDKRGLEKKYGSIVPVEILPGIYIQTGSKFQHSMGKAIFDGLMDEAAFGGANSKDAQKSYNELSSRMKTRFGTFSKKGVLPGHLFLISSPKEAGDFMQYRIEKAQEADSKLTKIMRNIATWDADPRKDSDEKFTVFIGNENKEPCIYEPGADIPIEEMDYLIYPPMQYYEEFKKDLLISIMNYGGITTTSDMALFKSPTILNDIFVLNNPFSKDVIELPFAKTDKQLMDFCDLDFFKDIRHPEYNRFIHLDAAYSTNTLDVYGLASSYCINNDITTFSNNKTQINEEDIFVKKDRSYFVDFVVGITAPKGQEVPLYKVQDFIEFLIKNLGYPVASISADQFQSKQTLQTLQTKGFNTENISVDRTRDPYLFLRMLIYNKQLLCAKNDYVKEELRKLRDDGKKVDHPVGCLTGDTVIKLLNGKDTTIKELADLGADNEFWVYACKQDGTIVPAKAYNAHKTKTAKTLIEITLDNDQIIRCTPEHPFMLRNGNYIEAQYLKPQDSLMPLRYRTYRGYEIIWDNKTNKQISTHRMVYNQLYGSYNTKTHVIHHYDINKRNNNPDNLKLLEWSEHSRIHAFLSDLASKAKTINWTPEKEKIRLQKFLNSLTPQVRQKLSQRGRDLNNTYWKTEQGKKRRQELSKTQLREASKIAYHNAQQRRLQQYNKIKDLLDFTHALSYKHAAQQIGYTRNNCYTIARAIEENQSFDFKTNIINLFNKYNFTWEQAKKYFNCNGYTLTYYLRKYNIEYLIKGHSFNHKVKQIKWLYNVDEDVYDITVPEYHNFAIGSGVFVHNSHKDLADAICGSIWNCANSNNIINKVKITQQVLNPSIYNPQQSQSLELVEFERIKQQYSNVFKNL